MNKFFSMEKNDKMFFLYLNSHQNMHTKRFKIYSAALLNERLLKCVRLYLKYCCLLSNHRLNVGLTNSNFAIEMNTIDWHVSM